MPPSGTPTQPTSAVPDKIDNTITALPRVEATNTQIEQGLSIAFALAAALAVLVIVIAAFNFATAEGDPEKIARSRRTIVHALIGLVIALLAEAIVLTVAERL